MNLTELKQLLLQTKDTKSRAFNESLAATDGETAERLLMYAESLGFAEVYLQKALVMKLREVKDEIRD